MDDLEQQIRAWAEHHAPDPDTAVTSKEVVSGQRSPPAGESPAHDHRRGRRLLAAAAVVLVAGLTAVAFAATRNDGTDVVADDPAPPTVSSSTTSTTTATVPGDPIPFDLLGRGTGNDTDPMEILAAATDQSTLNDMWLDAGLEGTAPGVGFSEQVIVAVTIPDGACPPTLDGVTRRGADVTPTFTQPTDSCIEPFIPATYLVALNWADTGNTFRLTLPADSVTDFDADLRVERPADTPPFTNPAEDAFIGAIERLGLEGCCGEPSHGGSDVTYGAVWDGTDIPVYGAPVEDNTYDLNGEPRVFVPFNDLVTSAEPATIDGAEIITGEADLGPFIAFTCGPHIWTIGGAGPGNRATPNQVRGLAAALIPELGCDVGEPPVATGHGNPLEN